MKFIYIYIFGLYMSDLEGGRTCRLKSSRYLKGRDSNSPT